MMWMYFAPFVSAAIVTCAMARRLRQRMLGGEPRSWLLLGFFARLAGLGVLVAIVDVAVLFYELGRPASVAAAPISEIKPGMSLEQVKERALKHGYAWRVDEARLVGTEKQRRFECHIGEDVLLCENTESIQSVGALFTSPECLVVVKGRVVENVWYYED